MRWRRLACLTALLCTYGAAGAREAGMDIGFLTCSVAEREASQGGGGPMPVRQTREMLCAFRPMSSGAEETYAGTFHVVGDNDDLSSRRALIWVVKGTSATRMSSGLLQQSYAADPAAVTAHAAPLVGENNGALVLHAMDEVMTSTAPDAKGVALNGFIVLVVLRLRTSPA
jgi:Protein of unknown function (DUF992)